MEKDEKLKFLLEQSISFHKLFLDLRSKILSGLLVGLSVIIYFIFTWLENPENYSELLYCIVCISCIVCIALLILINYRLTTLVWGIQNTTFLIEKEFIQTMKDTEFGVIGPYESFMDTTIKADILKNQEKIIQGEPLVKKNFLINNLNITKHNGQLNLLFLLIALVFVFLLTIRRPELNKIKYEYEREKKQKLELKINSDTLKKVM